MTAPRLLIASLSMLLLTGMEALTAKAQTTDTEGAKGEARQRPVTHATMLGIGGVNQLDTYLSPLTYHGPQLQFRHETLRATSLADSAITFQTIWQGNIAYTKNKPAKARYVGGDVSYDLGWHYNFVIPTSTATPILRGHGRRFFSSGDLRLLVGPQVGANVGFLYNTRNGNNPAQALASLRLSASAAAIYDFRLWGHAITARYQVDIPLVGAKFSPNYGQSYYEIFSLGHTDHNICFTHPFNGFNSRHLLSVDVPVGGITLRAAYLCDIRQSDVNKLRYHSYTHAFLIGWVRHLNIVRSKHKRPKGFVM